MTAATVITLGYGSFGTVSFVPTLGYGAFGDAPTSPPTEPPSQPTSGKPRKRPDRPRHRWAVWTALGYQYFDTAEAAYSFLYPGEEAEEGPGRKKKRIPRARTLGPAAGQPRVTYAGQDIAAFTVQGKTGEEVFSLGDRALARALQKRVEQELQKREKEGRARAEESERLRLESLRRERLEEERRERELLEHLARRKARNDNDAIALLLLAA
jgi:hypothetical protein